MARLAKSRPARGIDRITNDGMADVLAMDTNLMRATCLQLHFEPSCLVQTFDDFEMGDGSLPIRDNCHPLAVFRISTDRGLDGSFVCQNRSMDQSLIRAPDLVAPDPLGYDLMDRIILDHQK